MSDVGAVWLERLDFWRIFFFPGGFSPEEGILGNEENLIKSCNSLRDTDEDEKM